MTPNILKPITIDFKSLCDPTIDLSKEIEASFGFNGNGIMLINNIPKYVQYKNDLLPLGKKIDDFSPDLKRKYERPEINYLLGFLTYDKYNFKGKRDMSTSWYCSLSKAASEPYKYTKDGKEIVEKFPENFWPTEELPELELAFNNMGKITYEIAFNLGKHIEKWVKSLVPFYEIGTINRILKIPFGRLIHYHSQIEFDEKNEDEAVFWHSDTSSLSTLCSPLYLDRDGQVVPSLTDEPGHGLEILKRDGSINSCCIPSDCLALQIGEIFQIISGGKLEATPHRVVASKYPNFTREQFANFLVPHMNEILSLPEGSTEEDVFKTQSDKVPDLRVRWKNGDTYRLVIEKSFDYFR